MTGAVKEADLAKLELTEQAEKRLGVVVVEAKRQPVPRAISYGGEAMIPPGRLISVASPFLGTVEAPPEAEVPLPGAQVEQGQPIFVVLPILSPEARATLAPLLKEADGQVKAAQEQLKIAQTALDRAEEAVRQKLMPQASLIDAKAQYDVAADDAAGRRGAPRRDPQDRRRPQCRRRHDHAHVQGAGQGDPPEPPRAGGPAGAGRRPALRRRRAGPDLGQGAGLRRRPGAAGAGQAGGRRRPGRRRPACKVRPAQARRRPPSGDPLAATVHLFYEVDNKDGSLRPGQRVGVTLPLKGDEESLAVPRSALLRDAHGGTWVYENIAPHAYARRRVFVDRVVGDLAALASGLKPGAKVVTAGRGRALRGRVRRAEVGSGRAVSEDRWSARSAGPEPLRDHCTLTMKRTDS